MIEALPLIVGVLLGFTLDGKGVTRILTWIFAAVATVLLTAVISWVAAIFMPDITALTTAEQVTSVIIATIIGLISGLATNRIAGRLTS